MSVCNLNNKIQKTAKCEVAYIYIVTSGKWGLVGGGICRERGKMWDFKQYISVVFENFFGKALNTSGVTN